jgi:hypothetical protein
MDVIYTASPLKAFFGSLFYIGFCFVLGVGNLLLNYIPRKKRRTGFFGRHAPGCLAVFILMIGIVIAIATFNSYQNGDKTVDVKAMEKHERVVKCNEIYCREYTVETTDGEKYYVFGLSKETWEMIEVDSCYRFTYYPLKPLLADYLKEENEYPSLYEATGYITLIEKSGC